MGERGRVKQNANCATAATHDMSDARDIVGHFEQLETQWMSFKKKSAKLEGGMDSLQKSTTSPPHNHLQKYAVSSAASSFSNPLFTNHSTATPAQTIGDRTSSPSSRTCNIHARSETKPDGALVSCFCQRKPGALATSPRNATTTKDEHSSSLVSSSIFEFGSSCQNFEKTFKDGQVSPSSKMVATFFRDKPPMGPTVQTISKAQNIGNEKQMSCASSIIRHIFCKRTDHRRELQSSLKLSEILELECPQQSTSMTRSSTGDDFRESDIDVIESLHSITYPSTSDPATYSSGNGQSESHQSSSGLEQSNDTRINESKSSSSAPQTSATVADLQLNPLLDYDGVSDRQRGDRMREDAASGSCGDQSMWAAWHKAWLMAMHLLLVASSCGWRLGGLEAASAPAPAPSPGAQIGIGGLLAFNSTIGRAAKAALELAVRDVNNASLLGKSTQLVLHLGNTNCSAFQGAAAAMNLLKEEVVAIVGPQTSVVSHFVSHMGTATHVPLVSFSATDPSLSEDQYPYFVRLTHSDKVQMAAIAGIIQYYGWREVTALYTDDDFGNNGIDALGDALKAVGSNIVYKAGLDPKISNDGIGRVLTKLSQMESRVFVVHMEPNIGRQLVVMAQWLQMVTPGYVWIVTEAMSSVMDYVEQDADFVQALQGTVATRSYIPSSPLLEAYKVRWVEFHEANGTLGPAQMNNVYAWYAYDAVWMIAHAIRNFLIQGGATTFVDPVGYSGDAGGNNELANLKVFRDGRLFMRNLSQVQFTGITGPVQVDERGDFIGSSFEILNMVGKGLRVVGFWSNSTGCLPFAPSWNSSSMLGVSRALGHSSKSGLQAILWPGFVTEVPRGWVVPKNGRPLVIGVPNKIGYKEFVSSTLDSENRTSFHGFCIDVFLQALSNLPYPLAYSFSKYGNGNSTPSYDALVNMIVDKDFDAVVGDVTITTKRSMTVDFTQPYTTSGLAVVVPVKQGEGNHAWAFMRPFTPLMWITTGAFFFFTGLALWLLEHKKNRDFRGRPKKQIVTTLWFIFSTLFFSQREKVNSTLGRAVLIIWLFVVLIIISSYTASLTSLLTVQQLLPTIQGISSLLTSNVPIGYQTGSFVRDYLLQLNVAKERLVPLDTLAAYATALTKGPNHGGVGAIVDELPYVQLFLSSECAFTIAGQEFTKSGWGFAFPKGSELAIDFSTAILKLAENGELQRIHDLWLDTESCTKRNVARDATELGLNTFWGLFLITGCASVFCCLIYWIRMIIRHRKISRGHTVDGEQKKMSRLEASKSFFKSLVSFIEEEEVPTTRRSRHRRKSKEEWSSNAVRASSSLPKQSRRLSRSPESIRDSAPQEFAMPNWTLESKPTSIATPTYEAGTIPVVSTTIFSEQGPTLVTEATQQGREQDAFSYPKESAHGPNLEIQNFKFHDLGLPST